MPAGTPGLYPAPPTAQGGGRRVSSRDAHCKNGSPPSQRPSTMANMTQSLDRIIGAPGNIHLSGAAVGVTLSVGHPSPPRPTPPHTHHNTPSRSCHRTHCPPFVPKYADRACRRDTSTSNICDMRCPISAANLAWLQGARPVLGLRRVRRATSLLLLAPLGLCYCHCRARAATAGRGQDPCSPPPSLAPRRPVYPLGTRLCGGLVCCLDPPPSPQPPFIRAAPFHPTHNDDVTSNTCRPPM